MVWDGNRFGRYVTGSKKNCTCHFPVISFSLCLIALTCDFSLCPCTNFIQKPKRRKCLNLLLASYEPLQASTIWTRFCRLKTYRNQSTPLPRSCSQPAPKIRPPMSGIDMQEDVHVKHSRDKQPMKSRPQKGPNCCSFCPDHMVERGRAIKSSHQSSMSPKKELMGQDAPGGKLWLEECPGYSTLEDNVSMAISCGILLKDWRKMNYCTIQIC